MEISGQHHNRPFTPKKKPSVFHNKKVGELHNPSGRFGEKNLLPLLGFVPQFFNHPAISLGTVSTELFR
jgi:hypothetical protein